MHTPNTIEIMKAIYKALLTLVLMTAVPTSFTSCREDAPSVNQTVDITVKNEFSKLVEAINNGNLKREEAIKKVTEAIDGMNKSSSEILSEILEVLGSVNNTLETKLAAIEGAINSQRLLLEEKLQLIAKAIGDHMLNQDEVVKKITQAIDKLGGTVAEKLEQIKTAINSNEKTTQAKLDLILAMINAQTINLGGKLDALKTLIETETVTISPKIDILDKAMEELQKQAKANGVTNGQIQEQLKTLATTVNTILEEVRTGKTEAAKAFAEILKKLDELIAKINNGTPIPTPGAIDLGLSVLWSDTYLGAATPFESGDYYAWGELKTKEVYDWSNYKFARPSDADPNKYLLTKYCIHESYWGGVGPMDNKKHLDAEDDVVKAKLGGKWRMPTIDEVKELCDNCTWELKNINDVRCLIGTSKLTGKTITLSFSGYRDGDKVERLTETLGFWSNEIDARVEYEKNSQTLVCIPSFDEKPGDGNGPRYLGLSIRPVLAK